jgi:hypothetical protein
LSLREGGLPSADTNRFQDLSVVIGAFRERPSLRFRAEAALLHVSRHCHERADDREIKRPKEIGVSARAAAVYLPMASIESQVRRFSRMMKSYAFQDLPTNRIKKLAAEFSDEDVRASLGEDSDNRLFIFEEADGTASVMF